MSKKKLKFVPVSNNFHFYAASVGAWRTSDNLDELITLMKAGDMAFNIWYVPVPNDAPYEINFYAPQVDGAIYLGFYTYEVK